MLKFNKTTLANVISLFTIVAASAAYASDLISQYDTDGDGQLSKAEVKASNNSKLQASFDTLDKNSDGKLSAEELKGF